MINPFRGRTDLFGKALNQDDLERLVEPEKRNSLEPVPPQKEARAQISVPVYGPMTPSQVPSNLNLSACIQVPEKGIVIAKRAAYRYQTWEDTIMAAFKEGVRLPRIDEFMQHFLNLRDAVEGARAIYDGNGNPILQSEAEDLWNYVSAVEKFGIDNVETWLDARFKQDRQGNIYLLTGHTIDQNSGDKVVHSKKELISPSLIAPKGLVELSFDAQGLPRNPSPLTSYRPGENINFIPPKVDRVAKYIASNRGSYLNCNVVNRDAQSSGGGAPNSSLVCVDYGIAQPNANQTVSAGGSLS